MAGWSRCWSSVTRRSSWTRSKSWRGKDGCMATSATTSRNSGRCSERQPPASEAASGPALAPRATPPAARARRRSGWRSCGPCPSVTMAAVKLARPGSQAGSREAPASTTSSSATMGSRCCSTSRTRSPLASTKWIWPGQLQRRVGAERRRLGAVDRGGLGDRRRRGLRLGGGRGGRLRLGRGGRGRPGGGAGQGGEEDGQRADAGSSRFTSRAGPTATAACRPRRGTTWSTTRASLLEVGPGRGARRRRAVTAR